MDVGGVPKRGRAGPVGGVGPASGVPQHPAVAVPGWKQRVFDAARLYLLMNEPHHEQDQVVVDRLAAAIREMRPGPGSEEEIESFAQTLVQRLVEERISEIQARGAGDSPEPTEVALTVGAHPGSAALPTFELGRRERPAISELLVEVSRLEATLRDNPYQPGSSFAQCLADDRAVCARMGPLLAEASRRVEGDHLPPLLEEALARLAVLEAHYQRLQGLSDAGLEGNAELYQQVNGIALFHYEDGGAYIDTLRALHRAGVAIDMDWAFGLGTRGPHRELIVRLAEGGLVVSPELLEKLAGSGWPMTSGEIDGSAAFLQGLSGALEGGLRPEVLRQLLWSRVHSMSSIQELQAAVTSGGAVIRDQGKLEQAFEEMHRWRSEVVQAAARLGVEHRPEAAVGFLAQYVPQAAKDPGAVEFVMAFLEGEEPVDPNLIPRMLLEGGMTPVQLEIARAFRAARTSRLHQVTALQLDQAESNPELLRDLSALRELGLQITEGLLSLVVNLTQAERQTALRSLRQLREGGVEIDSSWLRRDVVARLAEDAFVKAVLHLAGLGLSLSCDPALVLTDQKLSQEYLNALAKVGAWIETTDFTPVFIDRLSPELVGSAEWLDAFEALLAIGMRPGEILLSLASDRLEMLKQAEVPLPEFVAHVCERARSSPAARRLEDVEIFRILSTEASQRSRRPSERPRRTRQS